MLKKLYYKLYVIAVFCVLIMMFLIHMKNHSMHKSRPTASNVINSICHPLPLPAITEENEEIELKSYTQSFWGTVAIQPVPLFVINTHDPIQQDKFISGAVHARIVWDPFVWDLFVRVLANKPKKQLVVDVGANLGYFSLMAASLGHRVVAFEPMQRNAVKFLSSIQANHFEMLIHLHRQAVWFDSKSSVVLQPTHSTNQGNGQIVGLGKKANTVRLDELLNEPILLLKIDVEGFEGAVLDGAYKLLSRGLIQNIVIECSDHTKNNLMCPFQSLLKLMNGFGYSMSDITPNAKLIHDNKNLPPNLLFILQPLKR